MKRALILVAALALSGCTAEALPSPAPTASPSPSIPAVEAVDWAPVDSGPADGAMGDVTLDASGVPLRYVVVEGDSADLIRARFDIWWDSLADYRGAALIRYPTLQPGDVLTFVAPNRLVDGGAREQANGDVIIEEGRIVGYLVAEGDVPGAITERFDLDSLGQIVGSDGLSVGDSGTIFPGERLTLRQNLS